MINRLRPWILITALLFSLFSTSQLGAMHVKGNELPATDLDPQGNATSGLGIDKRRHYARRIRNASRWCIYCRYY